MGDRENVLSVLTGVSRRLTRRRAIEWAAVGAIAAALAAAALELAWSIAAIYPLRAAGLCAAGAVAGAGATAFAPVRRRLALSPAQAALVASVLAGAGAGGVWAVLDGWHARLPKAVLPLVLLPLGAVAGAAVAFLRAVGSRQAAVQIDARFGLAERLATAEELARSPQAHTPPARCVYRQALEAVERLPARQVAPWRRGRATAAALALAAMLCLTLTALPTLRLSARLAQALPGLDGEARRSLADALRRAARRAGNRKDDLAAELDGAADAVLQVDEQTFRRILARLEERGIRLTRVVGRGALAAARSGAGGGAAGRRAGGSGEQGAPPSQGNGLVATHPAAERKDGSPVYVYDKEYAKVLTRRASRAETGPAGVGERPQFVRFDAAWSRARDRAERSLAAGDVPPAYRPLVRDFFAGE